MQVQAITEEQIKDMVLCKELLILLTVLFLIILHMLEQVKLLFMDLLQTLHQMQAAIKAIINQLMLLILQEVITMECMVLVQLLVTNQLNTKTKTNKIDCIYYISL